MNQKKEWNNKYIYCRRCVMMIDKGSAMGAEILSWVLFYGALISFNLSLKSICFDLRQRWSRKERERGKQVARACFCSLVPPQRSLESVQSDFANRNKRSASRQRTNEKRVTTALRLSKKESQEASPMSTSTGV